MHDLAADPAPSKGREFHAPRPQRREFFGQSYYLPATLTAKPGQGQWRISLWKGPSFLKKRQSLQPGIGVPSFRVQSAAASSAGSLLLGSAAGPTMAIEEKKVLVYSGK